MPRIERYNPSAMAPPFSRYSQGVEIPPEARIIIVAGQVGVTPDGTVPEGIAEQTEQAFRNVETVLREKGLELQDLVETRVYMTDPAELPGYRKGRLEVFGDGEDAPRPASALVFVAALAQPHWKIEICAMAAKI